MLWHFHGHLLKYANYWHSPAQTRCTLFLTVAAPVVAGHINPLDLGHPVITVSMVAMNRLLDLDPASQVATFGVGTPGPRWNPSFAPTV
ncbi:MAG: hypothetical protein ACJARK_001306 [Marinobacter psychrophilus]|jgi:hypothetical protein